MKILLINCPVRLNAPPNNIPYGLSIIANLLRNEGFEVEIYDINALRPARQEVITALKNRRWDIVGVSGLITTYTFQVWLISCLKKLNPESLIISGGGLATSSSELLLKKTLVDIAVLGEGELTMLDLCRAVRDNSPLKNVMGIRFRENGRFYSTPRRESIEDLDSMPFPAWDMLPIEKYLKNPIWGRDVHNSSGFRSNIIVNRSMNVISARGCPFNCHYCYHLFGRSKYRLRSAGNVVEEVEMLVSLYGVDFIGFVDDNTMADTKRLLELCDLLEKKRLPVTWGCHGRITNAEPEILQRMSEAGCVWIGYGIESGSQKILNAMNKKATVEQAKQAIINTRKANIYANTTFIFGYPGETKETIQATIDFKRELDIKCPSFFATPYPGTPLFEQVRDRIQDEEEFITKLGNATDFTVNLTDFDNERLFELKQAVEENRDVI